MAGRDLLLNRHVGEPGVFAEFALKNRRPTSAEMAGFFGKPLEPDPRTVKTERRPQSDAST